MAAENTTRSRRSTAGRGQTGKRAQQSKAKTEEPKAEAAKAEAAKPEQTEETGKTEERTATLNLPFVTAELRNFRAPQLNLPTLPSLPSLPSLPTPSVPRVSRRDVAMAGRAAASVLPPPRRLAYYTGLGALAAFEVIEWPVAAAIGVGTMVVQNSRRQGERQRPAARDTAAE